MRSTEPLLLTWTTTVAEVFPELAPGFQSELGDATLTQLLSHRAGLPRNTNYRSYWRLGACGPAPEQRRQAVKIAGAKRLLSPPGSKYVYSGSGYVIAEAMIDMFPRGELPPKTQRGSGPQ